MKYLFWETEPNGDPTGKEKYLEAPTLRWAAQHMAYTLNGKLASIRTFVIMPDGKMWFGER